MRVWSVLEVPTRTMAATPFSFDFRIRRKDTSDSRSIRASTDLNQPDGLGSHPARCGGDTSPINLLQVIVAHPRGAGEDVSAEQFRDRLHELQLAAAHRRSLDGARINGSGILRALPA